MGIRFLWSKIMRRAGMGRARLVADAGLIKRFPGLAMNAVGADGVSASEWNALRLLGLYRAVLPLLLGAAYFFMPDSLMGRHNAVLFLVVDAAYLAFSLVALSALWWSKPAFPSQPPFQLLADIVAITLLMHASGGVQSGLGILLIITSAAAGIFLDRRGALALAAVATLAVLSEQLVLHVWSARLVAPYSHAAVLGATFFGAALLANSLARRLRESEALAVRRGVDLANMAQLNEYIIQRIDSGILVVDAVDRIRLMNEAAWHLLGMPTRGDAHVLDKLSPELYGQLRQWQRDPDFEPQAFRVPAVVSRIMPRFARLGQRESAGTLIFLDDSAVMTKKAQDLKLKSLGRLTASIAHEIRNPLGAISHAAQLLEESPDLDLADRRLTRIVREQSSRMNTIIENIMQLSRRDRTAPEVLCLKPWLERFVEDFVRVQGIERAQLDVGIEPPEAEIWVDPSHLHQVLFNLCQNGLRHGAKHPGNPQLKLSGGITKESRGPFLDVIDFGSGIDPDTVQDIFEPFFTTEPQGTGLGLYIARELCESNQAHLEYLPTPTGGSCFRITFVDPKRRGS